VRRARLAAIGLVLAASTGASAAQSYAERFAGTCVACHGAQGVSTLALTPSLAGQPSFYAITQLFLFRDGRRDNATMSAVAKGMTDADLRGFSEHIATLPAPPPAAEPADAQRNARGAALAQRLHCTGCHGADLAGGKQVPRLAGQREDYLLHALRGFRAATRVGYTPAMTEALAGTTPEQLEDLAHHLAHAAPVKTP
jgi:cytochrome c553